MDPKSLARQIESELEAVSTQKRRDGMQDYFTTSLHIIGVTTPDLRTIVKVHQQSVKRAPPEDVLALALELVRGGTFEGRQAAYELVGGHKATMGSLTVRQLERLGKGNDNWASVDAFSCGITGMLWLQGHLKDATFCKWVQSRDLWWRRTAVVSTTPLNQRTKGGTGDFERTLAMVGRVQHERHPMIWKAVSWALRNLVQWDKDRVEAYVANHDDVLPAPVIREVRKKIETGVKTPRS